MNITHTTKDDTRPIEDIPIGHCFILPPLTRSLIGGPNLVVGMRVATPSMDASGNSWFVCLQTGDLRSFSPEWPVVPINESDLVLGDPR